MRADKAPVREVLTGSEGAGMSLDPVSVYLFNLLQRRLTYVSNDELLIRENGERRISIRISINIPVYNIPVASIVL